VDWRGLALDVVTGVVALFIRAYLLTLRIYVDRRLLREPVRPGGPIIAAFWHGHMLVPMIVFRNRRLRVLVSRSRDGERVARVAAHFGLGAVRGSSSRGGAMAIKELLELAGGRSTHLGVTPDGPRGPRHQVAPGIVYLASKTGFPIWPVVVGIDRYWVLPSKWDEFLLPRPFARAVVRAGEFTWVPNSISPEEAEAYRAHLEYEMQALTRATYVEARRRDLLTDPSLTVRH
jgi:lysophospholipid acyltransferase (LPLAT)-like uncharacterized protein